MRRGVEEGEEREVVLDEGLEEEGGGTNRRCSAERAIGPVENIMST
jgi:hypothetical protein